MAPKTPSKARVHAALLSAVQRDLARMSALAKDTAEGATHEEARSEGDKDMRATEQSYIARGQAMRAEELADTLGRLEQFQAPDYAGERPIGAGALIEADVEGETKWLYLMPVAGGTELSVDGTTVMVITPSSPVGRHIVGKLAGDAFELAQAGRTREWVIERVH